MVHEVTAVIACVLIPIALYCIGRRLYALVVNRHHGLRCWNCGYSTFGLPTHRCPECGENWTAPRREKRWWKPGLLFVLGISTWTCGLAWGSTEVHSRLQWFTREWSYTLRVTPEGAHSPGRLVIRIHESRVFSRNAEAAAKPTRVRIAVDGPDVTGESLVVSLPELLLRDGRQLDLDQLLDWWQGQAEEPASPSLVAEIEAVLVLLRANAHGLPDYHVAPDGWFVDCSGGMTGSRVDTVASGLVMIATVPVWFVGVLLLCQRRSQMSVPPWTIARSGIENDRAVSPTPLQNVDPAPGRSNGSGSRMRLQAGASVEAEPGPSRASAGDAGGAK